MTQIFEFAPDYPRDENGWIQFPRDAQWREELLGREISSQLKIHPAKMNMFLCAEIVKKVSKPGDTILDPFGGVGTTLVGALYGRNVVLAELETPYVELARASIGVLSSRGTGFDGCELGSMTVIQGDNRQTLPLPCDHIITSPPYGADLYKKEGQALDDSIQESVTAYASSPLNFGRFDGFIYNKQMDLLYKKMVDSLKPGGTITITHRDRSRNGSRILYGLEIMRMLSRHGMELNWWEKWKAPGSFQSRVNEAKGAMVILDEDIINYRKPE